ncbi:MAG: hypothetical protein ACO1SV_22605 [Fimbriimonas sp.]
MRSVFPPEWRTQNRRKRRFYATYMRGLERAGYTLVCGVFGAFVFAFNYKVDDLVTADKVAIQPFSTPLKVAEPVRIVMVHAADFEEVHAHQPIVTVAVGEEAIRRYEAWKAVTDLNEKIGATHEVRILMTQYTQPELTVLAATGPGTLRIDRTMLGKTLEPDAEIARVVDYRDLRLTASLSGQTVPQAKVGQSARVTAITVEPEAGTLFRGTGAVSGRLLGDGVRDALFAGLVGAEVRLRDDVPLTVTDVSEVQVDAKVGTRPGSGPDAVPLDPPANLTVDAQVVSGAPSASVQVADLPPDVAARAREAVAKAVAGKAVRRPDGSVVQLEDPQNVQMVVKLKASEAKGGNATVLNATSLSRAFDAELKIPTPPAFLIDAVREADRSGRAVTARVELRTGRRPIAFLLLRKS